VALSGDAIEVVTHYHDVAGEILVLGSYREKRTAEQIEGNRPVSSSDLVTWPWLEPRQWASCTWPRHRSLRRPDTTSPRCNHPELDMSASLM
jgi:hypothetical protein